MIAVASICVLLQSQSVEGAKLKVGAEMNMRPLHVLSVVLELLCSWLYM